MKTEQLEYTGENIHRVFHSILATGTMGFVLGTFSIAINGVEIVSRSNNPNAFNDFLYYNHDDIESIVFTVYNFSNEITHCFEFHPKAQGLNSEYSPAECARMKIENETLRQELSGLKKQVRKMERAKRFEKPDSMKAIDAGDCVVLFIPKKELDEQLEIHLSSLREFLNPLEKAQRYFRRFMYHPKKDEPCHKD